MAKNENGYPIVKARQTSPCASEGIVGGVIENEMNGCGCDMRDESIDNNSMTHNDCGGTGNCLDSMSLAYVYAPNQHFRLLYSAKDALSHGTLFEELYKPREVYGHE